MVLRDGVGGFQCPSMESVTLATLSAYSLVRNAEGSVHSPIESGKFVFCCVCVFFFNTLCHPPLRSLTAMRQVAALLNSKRSQRNLAIPEAGLKGFLMQSPFSGQDSRIPF